MFKRLRNKILITNMLIISAMLAVSFSVIYLITMQNTARDINDRLFQSIRQVYEGQIMRPHDGRSGHVSRPDTDAQDIQNDMQREMPDASALPENLPVPSGSPQIFSDPDNIPREMAARFEVVTDKDGNVIRVNSRLRSQMNHIRKRSPILSALMIHSDLSSIPAGYGRTYLYPRRTDISLPLEIPPPSRRCSGSL